VEGLVLIARDVTRQREMEMQALRSARLAAMGMLASGVAHDFNNLMAAILLRSQMLERALDDPEQRRWVEVIARSASDGAATVRRMLDFARLQGESGRMRLDVNELLRQVVELTSGRWKDQAQARGAAIHVVTDLAEIPATMANPSEIREVLTNLVLNAADALPSGGTITLRTRSAEGRVHVEVSDDGVGIPSDHLEKIFTPFFTTKGSRGTGLGLSVSAGILQRHDGRIRVESAPGRGTTFTVELPASEEAPERAAETVAPEVPRAATARILVVDDEADVREAMADILRLERHEVDEAPDGKAAIELASRRSYNLIVSDLGMPGMSGIEVLRLVRDMQPGAATMLVTGWGQQLGADRASEEGIDRILSKPVPMADLLRSVAELLSETRAARAT
jgi:nitrogen-specific signal transduction histidine kinase/ActR/RegA family two-component response regulator